MTPDPAPFPIDHLARRGTPSDLALVTGNERLSYAELDARVGAVAATLAERLSPGDRVASWMGKTQMACIRSTWAGS